MQRPKLRKTAMADIPPGATSPLDAAVAARDAKILDMVAEAIDKGDTMLAYQPVIAMRPPHPVAFYEGLIRVLDSTGRVIPAKEFIDTVEMTELGRVLDCLSLDAGLKTLAQVPDLRLSINMSARSIGYRRWIKTLEKGLKRNPTVGERLILEITERSAIAIPEIVADFMTDLQVKGIAFALDDFGTGYTTFRHFQELYFDIVKVEGSYVRGVHANPDSQVLLKALLDIARHFEMYIVAEEVEDQRDAEWLAKAGVDCVQGYLYGVPTVRPPWITALKAQKQA